MTTTNRPNLTDITDLSDAALDVFLRVKGGEDGVEVEHLSPGERYAVCEALGVTCPTWFLHNAPSAGVARGRIVGPDYEALILHEQDERFGE